MFAQCVVLVDSQTRVEKSKLRKISFKMNYMELNFDKE